MKRLLLLLVVSAGLAGCGASASQSEVWKHDTLYRNLDHLRFSWGGYRDASTGEAQQAREENWWGKEIPVTPGK
jgi:hypothetical protein